jgi:hypothetical protein
MSESRRQLLTFGVFCIILVVGILLAATSVIGWGNFVPLALGLFGVCLLVLAAMRGLSPLKYEREAFSTAIMGCLLVAVGGVWYLFSYNWLSSVAVILLVVAGAAIAPALRRK